MKSKMRSFGFLLGLLGIIPAPSIHAIMGAGDTVVVCGDLSPQKAEELARWVELIAQTKESVDRATQIMLYAKQTQSILEDPRRFIGASRNRELMMALGGELGAETADLLNEADALDRSVVYAQRVARSDPDDYNTSVYTAYRNLNKFYVAYQQSYNKLSEVDSTAGTEIGEISDSMSDGKLTSTEVSGLQLRLSVAEASRRRAADRLQADQMRVLVEAAQRENEAARTSQELVQDLPTQHASVMEEQQEAEAATSAKILTTMTNQTEDVEGTFAEYPVADFGASD